MKDVSGSGPEIESGNRDSEAMVPPPGRLRWRARRGQRELDLILERYLESRYPHAPEAERREFSLLLERPDPDILDWVLGRTAPPTALSHVVRALAAGH